MNKVWKMVGLATLVLAIGLLAAMPALAEEPAETAPMWQRMQQWLRGANALASASSWTRTATASVTCAAWFRARAAAACGAVA